MKRTPSPHEIPYSLAVITLLYAVLVLLNHL